jgi:hypothetical protein
MFMVVFFMALNSQHTPRPPPWFYFSELKVDPRRGAWAWAEKSTKEKRTRDKAKAEAQKASRKTKKKKEKAKFLSIVEIANPIAIQVESCSNGDQRTIIIISFPQGITVHHSQRIFTSTR